MKLRYLLFTVTILLLCQTGLPAVVEVPLAPTFGANVVMMGGGVPAGETIYFGNLTKHTDYSGWGNPWAARNNTQNNVITSPAGVTKVVELSANLKLASGTTYNCRMGLYNSATEGQSMTLIGETGIFAVTDTVGDWHGVTGLNLSISPSTAYVIMIWCNSNQIGTGYTAAGTPDLKYNVVADYSAGMPDDAVGVATMGNWNIDIRAGAQ